jgi:hypothetical protein
MDTYNRPDKFVTCWSSPDRPDIIKRGDRVSWRSDGQQRTFGRVIRLCNKDSQRAFSVREDDTGMGHIIPAKHITKEVG